MFLPREIDLLAICAHDKEVTGFQIIETSQEYINWYDEEEKKSSPTVTIVRRVSDNTYWRVQLSFVFTEYRSITIDSVEQVFEHIEFVSKTVFKNTPASNWTAPEFFPTIPKIPISNPPYETINIKKCSKCGITLSNMMDYCCQNYPCPTGLGGAYSSVVSTK